MGELLARLAGDGGGGGHITVRMEMDLSTPNMYQFFTHCENRPTPSCLRILPPTPPAYRIKQGRGGGRSESCPHFLAAANLYPGERADASPI